MLAVLAKQKMLPAIWFIFSRMGCDRAAQEAGTGCLLSRQERRTVQTHLDALRCAAGLGPGCCMHGSSREMT